MTASKTACPLPVTVCSPRRHVQNRILEQFAVLRGDFYPAPSIRTISRDTCSMSGATMSGRAASGNSAFPRRATNVLDEAYHIQLSGRLCKVEGDFRALRDKADRVRRSGATETAMPTIALAAQQSADKEVGIMRLRTILSTILSSAVLGTALGCSGQLPAATTLTSPSTIAATSTTPDASQQTTVSPSRFGGRTPGAVFVTSQGLYYDTFVVRDPLPMKGRFQLLTNGQTEFGPGQPGYLGGRWWEDSNGNGVQDAEDHFFLCPLLPPGRPTP
jgi:hypothetical protein